MVRFAATTPKSKSVVNVDSFVGIDYTSQPDNVKPNMSPHAPNMIRDVPGKVRKSMGWYVEKTLDGKINGCHRRRGDEVPLIHAGTKIYRGTDVLYSAAADHHSESFQFESKLYFIDGANLLVYDGTEIQPVTGQWTSGDDVATIPTLYIAEAPAGGGTEYQALNLMQPKWYELYAGTATDKAYHLTFTGLDTDFTPQAWLLNTSGDWVETTAFTVDYENGIITFTTAPGVSPVTGEDNVKILAKRTVDGYADRVNKCTVGIQFGVNGATDRLFLSGNPELKFLNYDWHSDQYDPTYFPDTGYAEIGSSASAVMGYAIVSNYLAAFKDDYETDRNVVIRKGDLVNSEPAFPIVNTLQGPGCAAKYSFAYLGVEPLLLTKSGIFAVTTSDISGERFAHTRSYYINTVLTQEQNLDTAVALVHDDMYWLFLNGNVWMLDDRQYQYPTYTSSTGNTIYSNRQLSCFNRLNVPAVCAWDDDGVVCFGTSDGRVCRFHTEKDALTSYTDGGHWDGETWVSGDAINACWDTPDLTGRYFYKNKSFKYLAVKLSPAVATSVALYDMKNGIWNLIKNITNKARYFSYANLCYSKLCYSNDQTSRTLHARIRIRKVDKCRFRFENAAEDEPFGLLSYAMEFIENGNYKR